MRFTDFRVPRSLRTYLQKPTRIFEESLQQLRKVPWRSLKSSRKQSFPLIDNHICAKPPARKALQPTYHKLQSKNKRLDPIATSSTDYVDSNHTVLPLERWALGGKVFGTDAGLDDIRTQQWLRWHEQTGDLQVLNGPPLANNLQPVCTVNVYTVAYLNVRDHTWFQTLRKLISYIALIILG